jgi:pimeloyl-ACP methyl ester carboxylesterase
MHRAKRSGRPDTIVLIHGLWMTPRCWEHWIPYYEKRGFRVMAPAYPGFEVEVEHLRRDPTPIAKMTVNTAVRHYERLIRELARPPILIGHSFGGAIVQILLDRGFGSAGVAIDSLQVKGVRRLPLTTLKSVWPILRNPANRRRAVGLSPGQFHYVFTNTLEDAQAAPVYGRYHIPAPGRIVFEGALANVTPHAPTKVDFKRRDRAPLLFIAGGADQIMPSTLNRANAKHYKTGIVAFREFAGRSHYTTGEDGWQTVADYALDWALQPTSAAA